MDPLWAEAEKEIAEGKARPLDELVRTDPKGAGLGWLPALGTRQAWRKIVFFSPPAAPCLTTEQDGV